MISNATVVSDYCHQNKFSSPFGGESRGCERWHGDYRQEGFTLIELMITVAIVAILAAIAYPSYIEHVRRAHRADAKTALLNDAQFLERNFTESSAYNKDAAGTNITDASLPHTQSPSSGTAVYTLSATTLTATTYTLTATPVNPGPMAGDACGALTLTHLGVKSSGDFDGDGTAGDADDIAACWNK